MRNLSGRTEHINANIDKLLNQSPMSFPVTLWRAVMSSAENTSEEPLVVGVVGEMDRTLLTYQDPVETRAMIIQEGDGAASEILHESDILSEMGLAAPTVMVFLERSVPLLSVIRYLETVEGAVEPVETTLYVHARNSIGNPPVREKYDMRPFMGEID